MNKQKASAFISSTPKRLIMKKQKLSINDLSINAKVKIEKSSLNNLKGGLGDPPPVGWG